MILPSPDALAGGQTPAAARGQARHGEEPRTLAGFPSGPAPRTPPVWAATPGPRKGAADPLPGGDFSRAASEFLLEPRSARYAETSSRCRSCGAFPGNS
ncbi:hypothetical protein ACFFX0_31300 [Citricoccus parietis]|uniref:Uncharacterized protein n=1 Tax=Citricoccus parietis TaxID=592307 RepID=A0ABV5G8Z8_9MICC